MKRTQVIELDIRNFKFFDESIDKKKYIFRMQSKPTQLATWANDLNNDDISEKLLSMESSLSSTMDTSQLHTDIYFKTKSAAEMKRILGLLQWKNSLMYESVSPLKLYRKGSSLYLF